MNLDTIIQLLTELRDEEGNLKLTPKQADSLLSFLSLTKDVVDQQKRILELINVSQTKVLANEG